VPNFRVLKIHTYCPGWQKRPLASTWRKDTLNTHISFSLQDMRSISVVHDKQAKESFYDISYPVLMLLLFLGPIRAIPNNKRLVHVTNSKCKQAYNGLSGSFPLEFSHGFNC